jgi:lipopolysaccharide/colanic/teichoic acid biosynthesis glycosyltransferase
MTRFYDILFSLFGLILLFPLFFILTVIGLIDTGSPFFVQERVGKNKKPFYLIKFRSMYLKTESVPTHLANSNSITRYGSFLRRTKLDELPQLLNVIIGNMSLVGPRPNLLNQFELIKERENLGVYNVRPGITGLAQINKIDMSIPLILAQTDYNMIVNFSSINYFIYIFKTIKGNGNGDRIKS